MRSKSRGREVMTSMHRISVEVDRNLVEFRRHPGKLVRIEGSQALVVIDTGDREVPRSRSVSATEFDAKKVIAMFKRNQRRIENCPSK